MIRAYDLAKVLGISSKELLDRLERSGLHLKSHSSNVDEDHVRSLLAAASPQKKSRPKPKPLET
ncbi:MAG: translation initiation factor IF-2 N-terminal domain-containing protein, partial [candidate division NC10 bacterium]|nr:translation initiation factor IF-2 N-terminal domain-containing protein [candidate division NC10 bacterium]